MALVNYSTKTIRGGLVFNAHRLWYISKTLHPAGLHPDLYAASWIALSGATLMTKEASPDQYGASQLLYKNNPRRARI